MRVSGGYCVARDSSANTAQYEIVHARPKSPRLVQLQISTMTGASCSGVDGDRRIGRLKTYCDATQCPDCIVVLTELCACGEQYAPYRDFESSRQLDPMRSRVGVGISVVCQRGEPLSTRAPLLTCREDCVPMATDFPSDRKSDAACRHLSRCMYGKVLLMVLCWSSTAAHSRSHNTYCS